MTVLGLRYAHLAMIFGIVLIATVLKQIVAHGPGPIAEARWLLAGGTAIYLLSDVMFRLVMGIRPVIVRSLRDLGVVAVQAAGPFWSALDSWQRSPP